MARLQALWYEAHPELTYMTQQNLRDQVAALRRTGNVQQGDTSSSSSASNDDEDTHETQEAQDLQATFLAELDNAEDRSFKVRCEKMPSAVDLATMNGILAQHLSHTASLWDINCAVYAASKTLCRRRRLTRNAAANQARRIQQLARKITVERQTISKLQCVMEVLRTNRRPSRKIKQLMFSLRREHHTLNLNTLSLLKIKAVDKLRSLSLARKRLVNRARWVEENLQFKLNPSRLFGMKTPLPENPPTVDATEAFWQELYGQSEPLVDTPVLTRFEEYCQRQLAVEQELPNVTAGEVKRAFKSKRNFAAPGVDGIATFWWKSFTSTHELLAAKFTELMKNEHPIPAWLVEGRTVLIPKTGDLSNPCNYRPITCLNTLYKGFTSVLNERILAVINPVWQGIYEQRGSKRGLAGCRDNLLTDRCICQDAVVYKRNLSMAWVDYKKAFDRTSHALIIRLLGYLHVHPEIVICIEHLMHLWRTRFEIRDGAASRTTDPVYFQRGVFQGDSLSPLLFCISLLPLSVELRNARGYQVGPPNRRNTKVTHLFYMDDLKLYSSSEPQLRSTLDTVLEYSKAAGMAFGLDKCATQHIRRGRGVGNGDNIELVDGSIIKHLGAGESYKYLGVAQNVTQDTAHVKATLRSRYKARLRQIWGSQLSAKNKVEATNVLAVPVLLYSFGVLKWNVDELKNLDRETRKLMNIHRSLHPKSSIQRIYLPRDQGGRGLLGLEYLHDRVVLETSARVLRDRDPLMRLVAAHELEGIGAFLFRAARRAADSLGLEHLKPSHGQVGEMTPAQLAKINSDIRKAEHGKLLEEHMSKAMHSVFFKNIREQGLSTSLTFAFLKSAGLKSETEGFIMACQDGVLNTLVYRRAVLKQVVNTSCRACKAHPETLMHLLSACPYYAASLYIDRHNSALRVVYYHLRHAYGIDRTPVLPYVPGEIESVVENSKCRIYWNYAFPTARQLSANKPDIVLLDLQAKHITIIELSCPAETNVGRKEVEKKNKYRDLMFELRALYPGHEVRLAVLIVGVLGGMKPSFTGELNSIPTCSANCNWLACRIQKAVLLGSLHLLRAHDVTR